MVYLSETSINYREEGEEKGIIFKFQLLKHSLYYNVWY